MPWGVLTPGPTQSWTSGDGVPEVSCATQEARAPSRRGAALLGRGPRHGPGLRVGSPGRRGSGVGRAEPGVALTVQDGWMPWGVWVWLSAPTGTWCPVAGDREPGVSCLDAGSPLTLQERGCPAVLRSPAWTRSRVGSPGRRGSGVGRAEPGVALTVQDGWMPWGVWVWLSAPTGTWCPVAGDKLSNDGRSKQARRTTQEGKLPCGAEVSGADSERVGPPETGPRVESLAW